MLASIFTTGKRHITLGDFIIAASGIPGKICAKQRRKIIATSVSYNFSGFINRQRLYSSHSTPPFSLDADYIV